MGFNHELHRTSNCFLKSKFRIIAVARSSKTLKNRQGFIVGVAFFKLEKKMGRWSCGPVIFNCSFSGRTFGLGTRGVHRQAQAGSMVSLQIQTGSFGEPPTPSASDLTLELDQY
jgi:hypothetical protein